MVGLLVSTKCARRASAKVARNPDRGTCRFSCCLHFEREEPELSMVATRFPRKKARWLASTKPSCSGRTYVDSDTGDVYDERGEGLPAKYQSENTPLEVEVTKGENVHDFRVTAADGA